MLHSVSDEKKRKEINIMLSKNKDRNELYESFLALSKKFPITVNDLIRLGLTVMRKANINHHYFGTTDFKGTSRYLVFWGLGFPYTYDDKFYLESKLTEVEIFKIINLFEKRIVERLPVEYITNEAWYNGYKFYVNENVLVPRSLMAKKFNDFIEKIKWKNYRVLDLCTGSGCIGITLALLNSKLNVDLVDISDKALEVTQKNIDIFKLHNRVKCFQSDVFENTLPYYAT
jgi:ribosomal protein L3 glutamine methyltransferase